MYGRLLRPFYILIFEKILGWQIIGKKPNYAKYVMVVAPHTSNWDFVVGLWARSSLRLKAWFIGKQELFIWPFGYFFRALGGFPVNRNKRTDLVAQIVELFNSHEEFNITIAPEGTRSYNSDWKTGFYQIALLANIPIQMIAIDYTKKHIVMAEPFFPNGNAEEEIAMMKNFFKDYKGKYPNKGIL